MNYQNTKSPMKRRREESFVKSQHINIPWLVSFLSVFSSVQYPRLSPASAAHASPPLPLYQTEDDYWGEAGVISYSTTLQNWSFKLGQRKTETYPEEWIIDHLNQGFCSVVLATLSLFFPLSLSLCMCVHACPCASHIYRNKDLGLRSLKIGR